MSFMRQEIETDNSDIKIPGNISNKERETNNEIFEKQDSQKLLQLMNSQNYNSKAATTENTQCSHNENNGETISEDQISLNQNKNAPKLSEGNSVKKCLGKTVFPIKYKIVFKKKTSFQCKQCGECFANEITYKKHRPIHAIKNTQNYYLNTHRNKSQLEKENLNPQKYCKSNEFNIHTIHQPYSCQEYGDTFRNAAYLQDHQLTHVTQTLENNRNMCNICGKDFHKTTNLKRHKKIHTGIKPYKCDNCNKTFLRPGDLRRHMVTHTREKHYKCDGCDKSFEQRSQLNRHKVMHTGEKPYQCNVCGKCFSWAKALKLHEINNAEDHRCKCQYCEKSFPPGKHLKMHEMVHTGERPFECKECGKGFTHPSQLQKHEITHTDEKPHKCKVCGKCFNVQGNLKQHEIIHTGEKPYQCEVCGKRFAFQGNVIHHKKTHAAKEKLAKANI